MPHCSAMFKNCRGQSSSVLSVLRPIKGSILLCSMKMSKMLSLRQSCWKQHLNFAIHKQAMWHVDSYIISIVTENVSLWFWQRNYVLVCGSWNPDLIIFTPMDSISQLLTCIYLTQPSDFLEDKLTPSLRKTRMGIIAKYSSLGCVNRLTLSLS